MYRDRAEVQARLDELEDMMTVCGFGTLALERAFFKHLLRRCGMAAFTFPAQTVPGAEVLRLVEKSFRDKGGRERGVLPLVPRSVSRPVNTGDLEACLESINDRRELQG